MVLPDNGSVIYSSLPLIVLYETLKEHVLPAPIFCFYCSLGMEKGKNTKYRFFCREIGSARAGMAERNVMAHCGLFVALAYLAGSSC